MKYQEYGYVDKIQRPIFRFHKQHVSKFNGNKNMISHYFKPHQLKDDDSVAWSRVLAPKSRRRKFTQPSLHLLTDCCRQQFPSPFLGIPIIPCTQTCESQCGNSLQAALIVVNTFLHGTSSVSDVFHPHARQSLVIRIDTGCAIWPQMSRQSLFYRSTTNKIRVNERWVSTVVVHEEEEEAAEATWSLGGSAITVMSSSPGRDCSSFSTFSATRARSLWALLRLSRFWLIKIK